MNCSSHTVPLSNATKSPKRMQEGSMKRSVECGRNLLTSLIVVTRLEWVPHPLLTRLYSWMISNLIIQETIACRSLHDVRSADTMPKRHPQLENLAIKLTTSPPSLLAIFQISMRQRVSRQNSGTISVVSAISSISTSIERDIALLLVSGFVFLPELCRTDCHQGNYPFGILLLSSPTIVRKQLMPRSMGPVESMSAPR